MTTKLILTSLLLSPLALAGLCLDPKCAPGGNFDLSFWNLQLPTGPPGKLTTIKSADLQGCTGYTDSNFYTAAHPRGAMVLISPGNPALTNCSTTSGSTHCRTELREVDSATGANAAWSPTGTNTLTVWMAVEQADDGSHGTAIGQVFASEASKPLAEMYYSRSGDIVVGVKPNASGNQIITKVGKVPVGRMFRYELSYSADVLTVSINRNVTTLSTYEWESPACYFKTGNYNQGKSADSSKVVISSIKVTHS